jgi:hypothetical protein
VKIPVFVSCPTVLNDEQQSSRQLIVKELNRLGLEPRALGRSDYPDDLPLREVAIIARHCAGGVILGFNQLDVKAGLTKPGTPAQKRARDLRIPSAWNHLEAGILFGLQLPLLVFREKGVEGGIFDHGVTDAFVHQMPSRTVPTEGLREVFLKWQARVRERYYRH